MLLCTLIHWYSGGLVITIIPWTSHPFPYINFLFYFWIIYGLFQICCVLIICLCVFLSANHMPGFICGMHEVYWLAIENYHQDLHVYHSTVIIIIITTNMELTPSGLNMFTTPSTDSLSIPLSQPGGAKLWDQHETMHHNGLIPGEREQTSKEWATSTTGDGSIVSVWKESSEICVTWGKIHPNSWLVIPIITGTFNTSFLFRSSSAVSVINTPSTTAPR